MPFVREHAARQADPAGFEKFRRNHPAGWPDGVDAVFGVKDTGGAEIQSVRLDKARFSPDQARKWLGEQGFQADAFEEAAKGWDHTFKVTKVVEDERLFFAWGYVTKDVKNLIVPPERTLDDGTVVDWSGEVVDIGEIEKAVYDYVENSREGDAMHSGPPIAALVESMVFTAAKKKVLGLPDDYPEGAVLGFRVHDDATWKRVRSGELNMLSLAGGCTRETF